MTTPSRSPRDHDDAVPITSGLPGLDDILRGGLPSSRIHLLEGAPGAGKTTLALQFLLEGVRQDDTVLYITLAETEREVQAVAKSHGWVMGRVNIL